VSKKIVRIYVGETWPPPPINGSLPKELPTLRHDERKPSKVVRR